MSASRFFPSIHDKMTSNWLHPYSRRTNPPPPLENYNSNLKPGGLPELYSFVFKQDEPPLPSDYQPLEFFSQTQDDCGPPPWGDTEKINELSITSKEIELSEMMEDTSAVQEEKYQMNISTSKIKRKKQRKGRKQMKKPVRGNYDS